MGNVQRIHILALATTLLALAALGAVEEQSIEVDGLSFKAPSCWKKTPPTSQMRKAQLTIEPAKGDDEPAELVLFVFPGGAGPVKQNIERWRGQFKTKNGELPEVESKTLKGQNVEATRVEIAGTYTDPFSKAGAKPNYRLLGAIVVTDDAGYFFKMVGPDKTMNAAEADFDGLVKSIKLKGR
jgi:hypothetical protein